MANLTLINKDDTMPYLQFENSSGDYNKFMTPIDAGTYESYLPIIQNKNIGTSHTAIFIKDGIVKPCSNNFAALNEEGSLVLTTTLTDTGDNVSITLNPNDGSLTLGISSDVYIPGKIYIQSSWNNKACLQIQYNDDLIPMSDYNIYLPYPTNSLSSELVLATQEWVTEILEPFQNGIIYQIEHTDGSELSAITATHIYSDQTVPPSYTTTLSVGNDITNAYAKHVAGRLKLQGRTGPTILQPSGVGNINVTLPKESGQMIIQQIGTTTLTWTASDGSTTTETAKYIKNGQQVTIMGVMPGFMDDKTNVKATLPFEAIDSTSYRGLGYKNKYGNDTNIPLYLSDTKVMYFNSILGQCTYPYMITYIAAE